MINFILKSFSYVFHPLMMPVMALVFYFAKSPRFVPEPVMKAKLFSITILTIILPILLYFLLKTMRRVTSFELDTPRERLVPLLLSCLICALIIYRVLPANEILELYYFFLGTLFSSIACFILALFNIKASIHMMGSSGFFMFAVAISIHYKINIVGTLAIMSFIVGAIATSRLHLKAHTGTELTIGFFIGVIPQLIFLNYWL